MRPGVGAAQAPAVSWPSADSVAHGSSRAWTGGVQAYWYALGAESYLLSIASADRSALHLEARYQYEALHTASAWVGWTQVLGARPTFEIVPMAGVLFGRSRGAALGFEATLSLTHFELYDEAEMVLFTGGEQNFLYDWFTVAWHATAWLDVGLSVQRTRTHASGLATDRGVFGALSYRRATLSVYGLDLTGNAPFAILALGFEP